jgi:hypothetical protein
VEGDRGKGQKSQEQMLYLVVCCQALYALAGLAVLVVEAG